MEHYENLFIYLTYSYYIFFILAHSNLWKDAPIIFEEISFYYKVFVAGTLAILFNPFTKTQLTDLRRRMIFTGATSLLFGIGFTNIYNRVKDSLEKGVPLLTAIKQKFIN